MEVATLEKLWNFLSGKKTFFIGLIIIAVAFAHLFGYVDIERVKTFLIILNGAGLLTLRHAISKDK